MRREIDRGSLRALRVGGRLLRIDPDDFHRWLERGDARERRVGHLRAGTRVLAAGYVRALWLAPDERFLPPGAPRRTVTLQEALEEITGETEDDG